MGTGFNQINECGNASDNPDVPVDPERRSVLQSGLGLALAVLFKPGAVNAALRGRSLLGFSAIDVSTADEVVLPAGYKAQVLYAWGDAIGSISGAPPFSVNNSAVEQTLQAGMHHDGMHFFPFVAGKGRGGNRGLLAVNHEYADDGLLHAGGMREWSMEKVRKSQAAHGVSVIEIERRGNGEWRVVRPSRYARRITADTPMAVGGAAAGDALLQTAGDPAGRTVVGTLNNCAYGHTPWGTYLTCEENWNGYFNGRSVASTDEQRYGLRPNGFGYRWHEHDERFDVARHPNEPNRFGWVVEIDPFDPGATPVKRTALGRTKHEGATVTLSRDGRAVVYMGDDERFEYIYKFVSRDRVKRGGYAANRAILDDGMLYVARLNDGGRGEWIELAHGKNGLTPANGFATQAEVLIRCRQAADRAGATKMDRPEWITVHPVSGEVFVTLTNNSERGREDRAATDAANPREANVFGHIVRWRENGSDASETGFEWSQFVLAGDPAAADEQLRGTARTAFGSPDGLWLDPRGILWVQTDISTSAMNKGPYAKFGNNQMLAADPATGEMRRFLVGPKGCEITGVVMSPDLRSMFVNIQHPGEPDSERSNPDQPLAVSGWPRHVASDRPRSATIVITRDDGGFIGG